MRKFDDSLSTMVEIASRRGVDFSKAVIVRDGFGRLVLATEDLLDEAETLERELRSELGAYASPLVLITGSSATKVKTASSYSVRLVRTADKVFSVYYGDRRIIGADWLASLAEVPQGPPRLVFASLKGGVGRSTALTVLAADLARSGKRVLAIDLDMEAPGIGFMLLPASEDESEDKRPKYGTVDYLLENGLNGVSDDELFEFVGVSPFAEGFVHVVPVVGRITDLNPETMIAKLSRSIVEDITSSGSKSFGQQINEMISRFASMQHYDAVLIDARAGMSEISAAPIMSLGAEVLLFGTDQEQTFRGYRYILAHISRSVAQGQEESWSSWRERISFVQSKALASQAKRKPFRDALYTICAECLYDAESLDDGGRVDASGFNPGPDEMGQGIPHDSWFIENHPNYDAFDPLRDVTQLDPDVYRGPFADFLTRAWNTLGLERA